MSINENLWGYIEIIINFYQAFLMMYSAYYILGDKKKRSFAAGNGSTYSVLLAVVISVLNMLTIFEHFYALIYIGLVFIYSLKNLNGKVTTKVYISAIPVIIMMISSVLVGNLTAVVFGSTLEDILTKTNGARLAALISNQLLISYLIMIFLKAMKKSGPNNYELGTGEWRVIAVVLLISIAIGALLNFTSLEKITEKGRIYIITAIGGLILINSAVCYLIIDLGNKNRKLLDNEVLKLQNESQRERMKNMQSEYEVYRKFKHDTKDFYKSLYVLIDKDNVKAREYLKEYVDGISGNEVFIRTDNDVVNSVVNLKLTEAKSKGIEIRCLSAEHISDISDMDLSRLLMNMLENAITACEDIKSKKKQMYLKISSDEYQYYFVLRNSIEASVLKDNPELMSKKREYKERGYGKKIIEEIAEKYDGMSDFYEEDGMFCCSVLLKYR